MSDSFLDEEASIASEQDEFDLLDGHALRRRLRDLPELQNVVKVNPLATVRAAINVMVDYSVGIVLVVENKKLIGVFSERDVLRKIAAGGLDVDATFVSDVMTEKPETLDFDAELVYALNKMTVGGYRHLPLMKNGEPVAVVSMRDIVGYIVSLHQDHVLKSGDDPSRAHAHDREGA